MRTPKLLALMLALALSQAVFAEGGKQRGDEGQGTVVQNQVREVDPPAQWSAADEGSAQPSAEQSADELEEWF
ncbi:MAG TPA: hypothetical protein PLW81_08700 [Thiobacillaceae bacterium]|nr:hypothetical protein [Thiobacillaceae bacterium]